MAGDSSKPDRLSSDESHQFAAVMAELTAAELPLAQGLRAAAEESSSRRLARALRKVAGQLEQGRSLAEVLADPKQPLPPHVAGVLLAGLKSGRLATALSELFEQQQASRDLRRAAVGAIAYPAVLVGCWLVLYAFLSIFLMGPIKQMFDDFELRLPTWVIAMLWSGRVGIWLLIGALVAVLVIAVGLRLVLSAARWQQVMSTTPLLGPIWHWSGVAEAMRLLALFIEQQIPLSSALALVAQGTTNAEIAQACRKLASDSESGQSLAELLANGTGLPPLLAPLVRWGETAGTLPAALNSLGEVYEVRALRRIEALRIMLPPLVFVLIGSSVSFVAIGLFTPLLRLISGLSM